MGVKHNGPALGLENSQVKTKQNKAKTTKQKKAGYSNSLRNKVG